MIHFNALFNAIFTLLWCSGSESTISLKFTFTCLTIDNSHQLRNNFILNLSHHNPPLYLIVCSLAIFLISDLSSDFLSSQILLIKKRPDVVFCFFIFSKEIFLARLLSSLFLFLIFHITASSYSAIWYVLLS